jgi:TRAP-type uncharacterized transport system fused permease subunit
MLQAGDPMEAQLGFHGAVALATFKALVAIGLFGIVAIGLFGIVAIGFLFVRLTIAERVVALVAALCLLGEFPFSDSIGFAVTLAIVLWQWRQRSRSAVAAA